MVSQGTLGLKLQITPRQDNKKRKSNPCAFFFSVKLQIERLSRSFLLLAVFGVSGFSFTVGDVTLFEWIFVGRAVQRVDVWFSGLGARG
jgi:hypothetical protein